MRGFAAVALVLLLPGCPAHHDAARTWLVYVRDVPVAQVTLGSGSRGNVVDVAVRGGTAAVTLQHSGPASLEPLREPPGLKVALHQLQVDALAQGHYAAVERALDETSSLGRDNLALALLKAASDADLARAAEREEGRRILRRLYDEVTSGSTWSDEREQAGRVLDLWAQRLGVEGFVRAIENDRTKVFPVRKPGPTVVSPVFPTVRPGANGLDVSLSSRVHQYPEGRTLPGMHFQLPDDEVVAVKLHDDGGVVRFVPALFLLEVSNAAARHTLQKCGEMFALGLTLGSGAVARAGGTAASALLWCDRTALALGVLLTVVDDQRGWILERFGGSGEQFLRYADGLASLVAFYGLGRVAVAAPRAVLGLRRAYLNMKAARAALRADEQARLDRIRRSLDELLEQVERAGKAGEVIPIERARKPSPAPPVTAEPLRATGTEGRLVPAGGERDAMKAVASTGGGTPKTPLAPEAPSTQPARAPGGNVASRPAVARVAAGEAEVAEALVRRGLPVDQARSTAQAAAEAGVLDKVEALAKSPGYRNPQHLRRFLNWNQDREGKIQALEDTLARLRKGHEVELEGGRADVLDYTTREAVQHKRIFGESEDGLERSLREAADQLRGGRGEVPPEGFRRVIDVRFDQRSKSPLHSANRNMLREEFPTREQLKEVDRIQITTDQGTYVFEPPFPIH